MLAFGMGAQGEGEAGAWRRPYGAIRVNGAAGSDANTNLTWLKLVPKGWGGDGVDEGLDFRG